MSVLFFRGVCFSKIYITHQPNGLQYVIRSKIRPIINILFRLKLNILAKKKPHFAVIAQIQSYPNRVRDALSALSRRLGYGRVRVGVWVGLGVKVRAGLGLRLGLNWILAMSAKSGFLLATFNRRTGNSFRQPQFYFINK